MADFTFDKAHLTDLKTKINTLTTNLMEDPDVVALQEWGSASLWDPSTWNSPTGGGGGGDSGAGAVLTLLPGNTDHFPAALLVKNRGTAYASSVINAVNWVHDVMTNLVTNIDFTVTKIDNAEHENSLTVQQAITDFSQTIGDLGGPPAQNGPPTITIN